MLKFKKIQEQDLELILKWRTDPEISRYMFTDIQYNMENQKRWFKKIQIDESVKYWMIHYEDKKIGVINLSEIDLKEKSCTWGYYIGDPDYRALGGLIPPYLYNYVLKELKLNKIIAKVLEGNTKIMQLHKMHRYRLDRVQSRRVLKNGKLLDVYRFELQQTTWLSFRKFKKFRAQFE